MTDNEFKELIDKQVCHIGEGAPSSTLGKEFDLYIDKQTHRFYRKSNDVWTSSPKEVIGQCISYLSKEDLKDEVQEFLVASGDASALVKEHNADADAHLTGFNHRLTSNQLFDYNLLPNTDFIQKGHLEERIKDSQGLKEHAETVASTTDLGHVKVDGNSIIVEDGVIRSIGGRFIGEVFQHPSLVPPEGAWLLNGQYINNCRERYKEFYQWLLDNTSDEMLLTPIYKTWTQPALTEDGTVGGDTYAARASSGSTSSSYFPYRSFNLSGPSKDNFCALKSVQSGWLEFYSPKPLKFTSLDLKVPAVDSKNYVLSDFQVYGSVDGEVYDLLASGIIENRASNAVTSVELSELTYTSTLVGYHYLKIEGANLATSGGNLYFPEVFITASEYSYSDYRSKGNILSFTEDVYQAEVEKNGVCGAFVIDKELDRVRLPKLNGAVVIGNDSADNGKSKFVVNYSSNTDNGSAKLTAIAYSYCIQVFNSTNKLSTQDSAFLTSQMQTKAQKDLTNVDSNIDFVIESYKDDEGNWYRKYRSGWVEQGGVITATATTNIVILLIPFIDVNYFVVANYEAVSESMYAQCYNKTTTEFTLKSVKSVKNDWYACGFQG